VNRRSFVAASLTALVAAKTRRHQAPSVGLHLTTYDDDTLRQVAAMGYRDVAIDDLYAPGLRAALDRAGLKPSAVHVTTPLLYRGLDRHLAAAKALGCQYFVCGRVDPDERRTAQDWHELAALFNYAGAAARKIGLRFGYRVQGDELDLIAAETDPALVWFEGPSISGNPGRFFALDVTDAAQKPPGVQRYFVEAKIGR
jgi:hypothetical protein